MRDVANKIFESNASILDNFNIAIINEWLDVARWSPSGGNIQPWFVKTLNSSGSKFSIEIDKEYQKTPNQMDFDGSMAILAIGGFCESLDQLARASGYSLHFTLRNEGNTNNESDQEFPIFWNHKVYVEVGLLPLSTEEDFINSPSLEAIKNLIVSRTTERGSLKRTPIERKFMSWIVKCAEKNNIKSKFISLPNRDLQNILKELEEIRWKNKVLYTDVLNELKSNRDASKIGIPFKSLRIMFLDQIMLNILKYFEFSRILLEIGFAKFISHKSTNSALKNADCFLYLQAVNENAEGYWSLGRSLQKIWLKAGEAKVGIQPFAGHLIIRAANKQGSTLKLEAKDKIKIESYTKRMKELWGIDINKPLFGLRLGYSDLVNVKSPRKDKEQFVEFTNINN